VGGSGDNLGGGRRWWLAALALALLLLGSAWALASPPLSTPDEDYHLASMWCAPTAPDRACTDHTEDAGLDEYHALVPRPISSAGGCFIFNPAVSASCRPQEADSRLAEARVNVDQYPDGFYRVMGLLVGDEIYESVLSIRLASWVLSMALLVAAAGGAAPALRRPFAIGVAASSVPLGVYLLASVHPSGVVVAAVPAFWCATTSFLLNGVSGRRRAAQAAVAVAAAVIALGARYDAGLTLLVASAAALLLSGTWRHALRPRVSLPLLVAATSFVVALQTGKVGLVLDGVGSSGSHDTGATVFENVLRAPALVTGALGTSPLGWFDVPMPPITSTLTIAAVVLLLAAGLADRGTDKVLSFGFLALALLVVPMYTLAADRTLIGAGIQPRYLLPLLPIALATALAGPLRGDAATPPRTGVVVGLLAVAHSAALHQTMRRYITGVDVGGIDLSAGAEWWWEKAPSPLVVWFAGSIAFAAAGAVAAVLTRPAAAGSPAAVGEPATEGEAGLASLGRNPWALLRTLPRSPTAWSSSTAPPAPGSRPRTSTPTTTAASTTKAAPSSSPSPAPTSSPPSTRPTSRSVPTWSRRTPSVPSPAPSPSTTSPTGPRS
jgi:hypothetical protein